eukprot:3786619-Prorocentrum_lima.AAC.1
MTGHAGSRRVWSCQSGITTMTDARPPCRGYRVVPATSACLPCRGYKVAPTTTACPPRRRYKVAPSTPASL